MMLLCGVVSRLIHSVDFLLVENRRKIVAIYFIFVRFKNTQNPLLFCNIIITTYRTRHDHEQSQTYRSK
jgi:hypothetical protein